MKIKFVPDNKEIDLDSNQSLLKNCIQNNVEIRSICKGVPSCSECLVRVTEGWDNILPPTKAELALIGTNYHLDGRRLSCQVRCFGPITVDLTGQHEKAEQQNKKIRGFRNRTQAQATESKAVLDTMVLKETFEEIPASGSLQNEGKRHEGGRGGNQNQNQQRGGGGNQNQNQQRGGGNQNQGQQQARGGEKQGGPDSGQQEGGKSGGGRRRNRNRRGGGGGGQGQQQAQGGGGNQNQQRGPNQGGGNNGGNRNPNQGQKNNNHQPRTQNNHNNQQKPKPESK